MSSVLDEVLEGYEPSPEVVSVMAGSKPAVVLGLDVGTSGVRAAFFDERGGEIGSAAAHAAPNLSAPSGFAEIDPDAAVEVVAQTIDDLFSQPYQALKHIELISVSCFWHSLMGVDAENRPTTEVFGWADTRSAPAAKELRAQFDETNIHRRTGCRLHPSYWPAKLLWLRKERPDVFKATKCWVGFGEYLALRFFGRTIASVSMASGTGLFNQRSRDWDHDFIRALNISVEMLPEIGYSNTMFPRFREEYARRWPQLSAAHFCPPVADGAANNIGAGCHTRDKAALMVGTSGALRVLYDGEPPEQLPDELWCYRADRTRVLVGGALSDGGGLYRWIRDSLAFNEDREELENQLREMEADAHGLTVLPFWAGERSPGWAPDARGGILGLSMKTQPIDILRAAMEAVAYRFALIARALERVDPGVAMIASGNALRLSPLWVQIIADVLGRPVLLSGIPEASTRGAALLALEAAGKIQSIEEFSVPVTTFEPDIARYERYQRGLERQQRAYELIVNPVVS